MGQIIRKLRTANYELLLIMCIDEYLDYHTGAVLAQCIPRTILMTWNQSTALFKDLWIVLI